jgi:outer membrane protein assembly factor BamB
MLHASNGRYDIVWLNNQQLRCYAPLSTEALNRCVTDEKIPKHITQAWGEFKVSEKALWQKNYPGSVAIAVAQNAVVVADTKKVTALALKNGKPLWSETLPAAPVPWGMAVDREGRVILTLVDGRVLCLGPAQ